MDYGAEKAGKRAGWWWKWWVRDGVLWTLAQKTIARSCFFKLWGRYYTSTPQPPYFLNFTFLHQHFILSPQAFARNDCNYQRDQTQSTMEETAT
jgi:hypothetical protein